MWSKARCVASFVGKKLWQSQSSWHTSITIEISMKLGLPLQAANLSDRASSSRSLEVRQLLYSCSHNFVVLKSQNIMIDRGAESPYFTLL